MSLSIAEFLATKPSPFARGDRQIRYVKRGTFVRIVEDMNDSTGRPVVPAGTRGVVHRRTYETVLVRFEQGQDDPLVWTRPIRVVNITKLTWGTF